MYALSALAVALAGVPAARGAEAAVPLLRIGEFTSPPTLDGRADEPAWAQAAGSAGFVEIGRHLPAVAPTAFLMGYDRTALYLFVRCEGEPLDKLVGEAATRDSAIWGGSLVEVFLEPEPGSGRYWHFMVNHAGAVADDVGAGGVNDLSANPEWQAVTGREGEAWTAEIAIPFASLGLERPAAGTLWRGNVCRNAAAVGELSAWSPVAGGFHQPEAFGEVVFAGRGVVAALDNWLTRAPGAQALRVRASGPAQTRLAVRPAGGEVARATEPRFAELATEVPLGTEEAALTITMLGGAELLRQSTALQVPDPWVTVRAVRAGLQRERELGGLSAEDLRGLLDRIDGVARTLRGPALNLEELDAADAEAAAVAGRLGDLGALRAFRQAQHLAQLPYHVTVASTMTKVQPEGGPVGEAGREVRISLARGEAEGAQVVVCPVTADLTGVRVSVSGLKQDDGTALPVGRVEVRPVGFVTCAIRTPGAPLAGRIPDVLLPDRAMDVPAGQRQPFFVTVRALPGDRAGTYRGRVRVQAPGLPDAELPLTVRLYDVDLPVRSRMRTAFCLWGSFDRFVADKSSVPEVYNEYAQVMLDYRLSPITMWLAPRREDGTYDFSRLDAYLDATVPRGLTTLNVGGNGEITAARDAAYAKAVLQHLRERGEEKLAYFYGHDEAGADLLSKLQDDYAPLVAADPDVRIMQTGWSPHPDLEGLVRIWCPLTASANLGTVRAAQQGGDEVWWYVCCGPTAPYANLFVDYPGIDHRLLGWMTFQHGIEGLLYWGVDVWPGNERPLEEYDRANYANWNPNSFSQFNGDGYLLYPGLGDRPVPSFRLAALRDGIEDYDLFHVLRERAARGTAAQQAAAEGLLKLDDLIPSLVEYTQDPQDILRRREAVLRLAEELGGG